MTEQLNYGLQENYSPKTESIKHTITKPNTDIYSLQFLRGAAALAVVFFHTHVILGLAQYGSIDAFGWIANKGWLGVNFFFILSGFIIFMAHRNDFGKPERAKRYILRRVVRVYPLYWLLTTAFIGAAAFKMDHSDFRWDFGNLFATYSLLMVVDVPMLPLKVAWTLLFEIKFYLLFALLIILGRRAIIFFYLWGAAIIIANLFFDPPDWGYLLPSWGLLNIWNLNFLLGMAGFVLAAKLDERLGPYIFIGGVAWFLYLLSGVDRMEGYVADPWFMIPVGFAFLAIIVGAVLSERRFRPQFPRWCLYLGDASYAIYLVHSAAISLIAAVNFKLSFKVFPDEVIFIATFVIAVIAGSVVHSLIERPLLTYSRRGLNRLLASKAV
jgi:peptidoglycan/LPS O-acetylase OafA/YrhL